MSDLPLDIKVYLEESKMFEEKSANFPNINEWLTLSGTGAHTNAQYLMDINRKRCTLSRITLQERVYTTYQLLRLDIDTKPHRNPDGQKIGGTHLHIYNEHCGDAYAYELTDPYLRTLFPDFDFTTLLTTDQVRRFYAFCRLCNFSNTIMFQAPLL